MTPENMTNKEAIELAERILNDDGRCLESGRGHSMNCADGRFCEDTRRQWARALAEYVVKGERR